MAPWSNERVWDAVESGRWLPPGATRVTTEDYELAVTPGSWALTFVYGFSVADERRLPAVLGELRHRILGLGGNGARLTVTPRSRPADLANRLPSFGYKAQEETQVLVRELGDVEGARIGARSPEGIEVREVRTEEEYRAYLEVADRVFGAPPSAPAADAAFLAEFRRVIAAGQSSDRYAAWDGPNAVGAGGFGRDGPVARLWGGAVLPAYRGRGIYVALTEARLAAARAHGAEIALVSARVGSSAPILLRHGFRSIGSTRPFEVRF